jgi:PIN domain nuclease of toxin-antitoxin system
MKLLLDTHVWLWSQLAPEKLTKSVSTALTTASNELWLSPISVWEFLLLVEKKRIVLRSDPKRWLENAFAMAPVREAPLNREVAIQSRSIRVPHQDPADRFIAASAAVHDLTLVTDDAALLLGKGLPKARRQMTSTAVRECDRCTFSP